MIAIDRDTISYNLLEPPTGLNTIFFHIDIIKYHWTLQLGTCKLAVLQQVAYLMIAQQAMVTVAGGKSWKDRVPLLSHAAATGVSLQSVHIVLFMVPSTNVCMYTAGGWQQQMTFQRHVQNLQKFYRMLQNNGFHKDHIKTFFASSGQLPGKTVFAIWKPQTCLRSA